MRQLVLLLMLVPLLVPSISLGQAQDVPLKLGFQGRLVASDGKPLVGVKTVTFKIHRSSADPSYDWDETQTLALTNGFYATFLGASKSLSGVNFDGADLFVSVTVDGMELRPRQQIGSVVNALRARQAVRAYDADRAENASKAATATNLSGGSVRTTGVVVVNSGGGQAAAIDGAGNASFASANVTGAVTAGAVIAPTINAGNLGATGTVSAGVVSTGSITATSANLPGLVVGYAAGHASQQVCYVDCVMMPPGCTTSWGTARCDPGTGLTYCEAGTNVFASNGGSSYAALCVR